jgi:hypothetical protein
MNIGNHLLAYFHALYIKQLLRDNALICFNPILELGLESPCWSIPNNDFRYNLNHQRILYLRSRNRKGWPKVMALLASSIKTRIQINEPMMNLDRLISPTIAMNAIPGNKNVIAKAKSIVQHYIDNYLFVNIRAGDILEPIHRSYRPLKIEEIKEAQNLARLPLVFYGQTQASAYMNEVRSAFPCAKIIYTNCPYTDFEITRLVKRILIPVSTFSWVATWLSSSVYDIYYPNYGLYSKKDRPDVKLINQQDSRYQVINL